MTWLKLVPAWCWWLLAVAFAAAGQQASRPAGQQARVARERAG